MPEFAGFHAGLCRAVLTQMSEFARFHPVHMGREARSVRGDQTFALFMLVTQVSPPLGRDAAHGTG